MASTILYNYLAVYCSCTGIQQIRLGIWPELDLAGFPNQTVSDGVAHSKNPKKSAYHVTFDLDLEHTLDAGLPGDHRVQVWWRSGHLPARRSDLRKSLQTDRRRTPLHCISSFLGRAKNGWILDLPELKFSTTVLNTWASHNMECVMLKCLSAELILQNVPCFRWSEFYRY